MTRDGSLYDKVLDALLPNDGDELRLTQGIEQWEIEVSSNDVGQDYKVKADDLASCLVAAMQKAEALKAQRQRLTNF